MGLFKTLGKVAKFAAPIVGMIPGVGTIPAAALGGLGGLASGGGLKGMLAGAAGGAAGGLAGGALGKIGGLSKVGGFLKSAGLGPLDVAGLALGGIGAVQGAKSQGKANAINADVLKALQAQEAQRAGLRDQLMARLGQPQPGREDLSSLFASENPFARAIPRPGGQQLPGLPPGLPSGMPAEFGPIRGGPSPINQKKSVGLDRYRGQRELL